jgi:WD40 repeat protein
VVLTACLACDRPLLEPRPDGNGGRGGTSDTAGAPGGTAGAGGSPVDTGEGGGPGGAGAPCMPIATGTDAFNPCGRTLGLAYSPDGQVLAAGMEGQRPNVHLWRLSDGAHVRAIEGISERTYHVAFSPDGTLLATAGGHWESGSPTQTLPDVVKIWNVADGSALRTIPARCGVYATTAAFSHDGTLLMTAGHNGPVEIWRVADGTLVSSISYPTSVHNARFSPDDSQVIVGGVDRRATVWSVQTGALMLTLEGTADEMADAAFSPDGGEIATTALNFTIALWDGRTGGLHQLLQGHDTFVSHVVWVGQNRLVSNDWGGTVIFWSRNVSGDFVVSDGWGVGGQSLGIAVSPDQRVLATGGADPHTGVEGFYFIPL